MEEIYRKLKNKLLCMKKYLIIDEMSMVSRKTFGMIDRWLRRNWSSGGQCSRLQLPLQLALAVTLHKSQGLTLHIVGIDTWKEFSCGLSLLSA
uniref:ATP-dependent DNA helicase n=1 Tax=Amphimedon queenslandica TaxID=400682 RepID=A0A1X7V3S9_AMPQE